jgi:rRNA maturation RNase YbeY
LSSATPLEVSLLGLGPKLGIDRTALEGWLASVVRELAPDAATVGVRFVGDAEMRELNLRYRGLDHATDVLSFEGDDTPDGRHLGDLVVSLDTARGQAAAAGLSLERELRELLLHGVLHCLGHDHERDRGEMDRLELSLRERFVGIGTAGSRA